MQILRNLAITLLFVFVLAFLIHTNTAFSQDLGRHIKLGEIIWQTHSVPKTNLFSYTYPGFLFINHHWFSEVIFYLLYQTFGILSISYLKITVIFTAAVLIFLTAIEVGSTESALLSSTIFFPLLMYRTDERPEIFGLLFFSLYLFLYLKNRKKEKFPRVLYAIPIIQLFWVNMHVTFIYGIALLGLFAIDYFIVKKKLSLFYILVASILISLLNPHGLTGFLYPLSIFKNYGYSIQENQNVFFLAALTSNIFLKIFWIEFFALIFGLLGGSYFIFKKHGFKNSLIFYLLGLIFSVLSIWIIRNFPFFALSATISLAYFLNHINIPRISNKINVKFVTYLCCVLLTIFYIFLIGSNRFYQTFDQPKKFELVARDDYKQGVDFFLRNNLPGPILNNFDIGGYLDFRLYPQTKVFVDNRPEAYPSSFFLEYKEGLADPVKLRALIKKYNIQTIIFSHTDGTPWGIEFVKNTTKLKDFHYVYLDRVIIILTKQAGTSPINVTSEIEKQINNAQDYRDLITISSLATSLGKDELASDSLQKAYNQNPDSCGIRLALGGSYLRSQYDIIRQKGIQMLKSTSLCPYPANVKEEVKNINDL